MKYGMYVNQKAVIESGMDLDVIDCCIIDYIKDFAGSRKIVKIQVQGNEFFWIQYEHFINEMPILKINSKEALKRRLDKLVSYSILEKHLLNGNSTYFRFGDGYDVLISDTTPDFGVEVGQPKSGGGVDSGVEGGSDEKLRGGQTKSGGINKYTINYEINNPYTNNKLERVFIDDIQYGLLVKRFGKELVEKIMVDLENYIIGTNKKYANHYLVVCKWIDKAIKSGGLVIVSERGNKFYDAILDKVGSVDGTYEDCELLYRKFKEMTWLDGREALERFVEYMSIMDKTGITSTYATYANPKAMASRLGTINASIQSKIHMIKDKQEGRTKEVVRG